MFEVKNKLILEYDACKREKKKPTKEVLKNVKSPGDEMLHKYC